MTTTDLAAALIAGLPRYACTNAGDMEDDPFGKFLFRNDVLAALTAALTAALDGVDERAGEVLEGVTPGPWVHDGEPWNLIVWDGNGNRVCFMAHSNGLDDARDVATARFIAWCREGVPALLAQIAALRAENRKSAMDAVSAGCQAQEAWEAQKAAEAERDALRAENEAYRESHLHADKRLLHEKARAEAAEAQNAALTARVEGLTEALESIANDVDLMATGRTSLLGKMGRTARAALSTTEADNDRQA